jgi:hypothetical protein
MKQNLKKNKESTKQKSCSFKRLTNPWLIWLKWGGERPPFIKLEMKWRDNNKYQGNPGNHQGLFWKPVFN